MEQVTQDFLRETVLVTFDDGSQETFTCVERWGCGESIELRGISEDSWSAGTNSDGEPWLNYSADRESEVVLSTHNLQKIEVQYVHAYTAVADVSVENVIDKRRPILGDKSHYEATVEDVEIWEKHEWEAHNSDE